MSPWPYRAQRWGRSRCPQHPRGPAASPGGPKAPGGKGWGWEAEHWGHHHPKTPRQSQPHAPTLPQISPCPIQPCVPFPKQPQGGPGVGWVPAPVWGLVSHPKRNQTPSRTGERTRQSPAQHNLGFPAPRGSCCTRREPPGWGETGTFEDSQALEQLPEHLPTGEGIACPAGSQKYPKPDPRDWGTLPEDPPVVGWLRTRVGHERPG